MPPSRGWNFRLEETTSSLAFSLGVESGVCPREGVLCGSGGARMKAGRLSLRHLALEESASLSAYCTSPL